jgi:glycosyltransferase involved in cell wall biosynthesis
VSKILYEAQNLVHSSGTGIATYARNLASVCRRLGYEPSALLGIESPTLKRNDPGLAEVVSFDAARTRPETPIEVLGRFARYPFNALGGWRPVALPRSGIVIETKGNALSDFATLYALPRMLDNAMAHFHIYGRFATVLLEGGYDAFHATHPLPIRARGMSNIYTVHDLIPLRLPYTTQDDKRYYFRLLRRIAKTADHIITVSEHSRRDIIKFLNVEEDRVTNTYQAVQYSPAEVERPVDEIARDLEAIFGLEYRKYFLFYGAIEPKKNVSRMIDAYVASQSNLPLVLAGSGGWQNRDEIRKIQDDRFISYRINDKEIRPERRLRWLRYLPPGQLVTLIQGATAILFPSIYEGFGLPVVEAMALGTPVLSSKVASLPEVAGEAALLVDPYDTAAIARGIAALAADEDLRGDLIRRGKRQATNFSVERYEERLGKVYRQVLG